MATSVVLVVGNQLGLTRACLGSLRSTTTPFDLCVVDNGSTDGTRDWIGGFPLPYPLTYHRNETNRGLIPALDQAARLAKGDVLCFLHNDIEMRDPRWLERQAALRPPGPTALAGLCGVRRLRRDGCQVGRTIVHCLEGRATLAAEWRCAAKWRHRLPSDVRRLGERLREWCRPRRTCAS